MRNKENKNVDKLLYQALTPEYGPGEQLNQKVLRLAQEQQDRQETGQMGGTEKPEKHRKVVWAAKAAALLLMLAGTSGTVYAAWRLYTAEEVAQLVNDHKLDRAFRENAGGQEAQGAMQAYGGYRVTLLGVVSGEDISDYPMGAYPENIQADRTYAVVAIQREDGAPVAEDDSFFVSPLIQGYDPVKYNAASMRGAATFFEDTGVLYWLVNCSNVEYFADHTIYLCVADTDFYRKGLYIYDETDGSISRNEDYQGLNALFELELDSAKADPVAAQALLKENQEVELKDQGALSDNEADRFLAELTSENLEEKCVLLEDTCQTVMPDEEGRVTFNYLLPGEDPSYQADSTGGLVDWLFRRPWGEDERRTWSASYSYDLADLIIHIYTLNDDGSVSFGVYVPRDVSIYLQ